MPSNPLTWLIRGDFGHYYASAVRMVLGENPYHGTLIEILVANGFPIDNIEFRATNPPALILLTTPFSLLPPFYSFWTWNFFQIGIFLLGAIAFYKRLRNKESDLLLLSLLALGVSLPFVMHIRLGQTQLLVTGLVMLGLSQIQKRPHLASFALGVCASIKLFTLPLILLSVHRSFFSQEKVKTAWLSFGVGFCLLPVTAELMTDGLIHREYVTEVIPFIRKLQFQITGGTSLSFLLFYLILSLILDWSAPQNLPHLVGAYINMLTGFILILLVTFEFVTQRKSYSELRYGLYILVCSVLCSPVAWPHYFVTLYPVFLYLWTTTSKHSHARRSIILLTYFFAALTPGFNHALPLITAFWGPTILFLLLPLLSSSPSRTE